MGEIDGNEHSSLPQTEVNYANVDITDDFMFAYVMQRPDLCIGLCRAGGYKPVEPGAGIRPVKTDIYYFHL